MTSRRGRNTGGGVNVQGVRELQRLKWLFVVCPVESDYLMMKGCRNLS